MDLRFALVEMPLTKLIMDHQLDGWKENADEALSRWPIFEEVAGEAPRSQVSQRVSGWRALPFVATIARLWPVRQQCEHEAF